MTRRPARIREPAAALALPCVLMLLVLALAGCGSVTGDPVTWSPEDAERHTATAYTTRLAATTIEEQAIVITNVVYPATREENAAGAIILCPQDEALAFTAMHRITHMPVNAPMLYLDEDGRLGAGTKEEMKRLRPDGVVQDGKVQVYIVGEADPSVAQTVRDELEYKVREFRTEDPIELAELLDRWQAALKSDHPDETVISALDHPDGMAHGMGAMGWNAHMGRGFGWVTNDSVPEETRKILDRRFGGNAYIYLTGGPDVISSEVARELSEYGLVRRVYGDDVFASNTVNAGYKDFGRDWAWWWGWRQRSFGWGISQSGHNFIISTPDDLLRAIPAAVLGHMGKHGPLLLVEPDAVPQPVMEYLQMVRPTVSGPTQTIVNHAWIIGDEETISWEIQQEIHSLLAPSDLEGPQPPQQPSAGTSADEEGS